MEVAHVVAGPSLQAREVRDTAAEDQSAYADVCDAPGHDGQLERVERLGDVDPAVARADGDGLAIGRDGDGVQVHQVDGHAVGHVRAAREGGVPAALDGEGCVPRREDLHDC